MLQHHPARHEPDAHIPPIPRPPLLPRAPRAKHSPYDLRRIKSRDLIDTVLSRAELLPEPDAALLCAVYDRGLSVSNLALTTNADVRALRKRVRVLVARVMDPSFAYIAHHAPSWPEAPRQVATLCLLQGLTVREAAARLSVSCHTVRRNLDAVRALTEIAR